MAALPPRRLMSVAASGEMTMSIEFQAPLSSTWMRSQGVEMRSAANIPGGMRTKVQKDRGPVAPALP